MTDFIFITGPLVYLLVGIFIVKLIDKFTHNMSDDGFGLVVSAVFWPIILAFVIVIWLVYLPIKLADLIFKAYEKRNKKENT